MVEAVDPGQPSLFHKSGTASTEAGDDGASTEAKGLRSRLDDLYLNLTQVTEIFMSFMITNVLSDFSFRKNPLKTT